jgi:dipeptidyl aminopeptidase/acylaminoacyl peptidase
VVTTPFHDLGEYQKLVRLGALALSPDGSRLVCSASHLDADGTRFRTALWEVDPAGERPARRLTWGAKGESSPAFLPDGDLLFTGSRPEPGDDEPPPALWLLPGTGGEARLVGSRPGGVGGPVVARGTGRVVVTSATMPAAVTAEDDTRLRTARKERKVSAVLHDGYPTRFWDTDLGPAQPRLLVAAAPADEPVTWTDLTPAAGRALWDSSYDVSADGATVVVEWKERAPGNEEAQRVVAIDTASGEHRTLLHTPGHLLMRPRIDHAGRRVVVIDESPSDATTPIDQKLVLVDLDGSEPRPVAAGWDRWPAQVEWTPDDSALIVTADEGGRSPVFRVDVATGVVTRLTGDDGAYTAIAVAPDGASVYALRSSVDAPPAPVRLDAHAPDQQPVFLLGPAERPDLPGTLTEVTTTAADGSSLRAWLVLPDGASAGAPAPLVLWVHGGPLGSWNAWQWRWNPWLMAARGYAVLLPDPALSTGYGMEFVRRGWGRWGGAPYTDLLSLTDAAEARPDVDASRTAAMGGSFGGYMANWIAGHTDRFRAIVTHASLWNLDAFCATTDTGDYWRRELTPAMAAANSPHRHAAAITTPMLVIHGDKDYRVPVGEAMALWFDLVGNHPGDPAELPHRFLYFPDENHWVLTPNNAMTWYETVFAFLAQHVLGQPWERPEALG